MKIRSVLLLEKKVEHVENSISEHNEAAHPEKLLGCLRTYLETGKFYGFIYIYIQIK